MYTVWMPGWKGGRGGRDSEVKQSPLQVGFIPHKIGDTLPETNSISPLKNGWFESKKSELYPP